MIMLTFRFDSEKTLQAARLLLDKHEGCMSFLRLLKLLYIADRELLTETGRTLTGDKAVAMKHGPVLSTLYDVLKQQSLHSEEWAGFIRRSGYQIRRTRKKPGLGKLSKKEAAKLEEVFERYHAVDDWELSVATHRFAEWQKHFREGTATPIPWEEVLNATGRGEWIPELEREEAARRVFDSVFGS
jgi:uncharacterized phage-associated protein